MNEPHKWSTALTGFGKHPDFGTMPQVLVLHFNSIQKYPPACNAVAHLKSIGMEVKVLTTAVGEAPVAGGVVRKLKLTWEIFKFHLAAMAALKFHSFDVVIAYEHFSILPIKWRRKSNASQQLWLHFHEYMSPEEIACAGAFSSLCWKHVPAVVKRCDFTSHTNGWRLNQFRADLGLETLSATRFGSIPNTPPQAWLDRTPGHWNSTSPKERPLRLVYHGALHRDTTYIERLCELLHELKGAVTLSIYTNDNTEGLSSTCVDIHPAVPYSDLPEVLAQFDLGLIIYRGLIPNYQFNQPNKLWEYLGCKLPVLVSSNLDESMIPPEISGRVATFDFQRASCQEFIQTLEELLVTADDDVKVKPFEFHLQKVIHKLFP